MTVKELIEQLQKYPTDKEVYFLNEHFEKETITLVGESDDGTYIEMGQVVL